MTGSLRATGGKTLSSVNGLIVEILECDTCKARFKADTMDINHICPICEKAQAVKEWHEEEFNAGVL
jgi:hypothetical protein